MSTTIGQVTAPVPAGWYPDAEGNQRWWDGNQWTDHVVRTPHPVPAVPQHIHVHQDRGKRVNHALHLILTIFTMGLWLPVWLIVAIAKN